MFESINRITEVDPNCLFCLNFLLAQDDYTNFIEMMLEYKAINDW